MSKKVLVIGGGASGLVAAGRAAELGSDVTLLERNARCARKVMITGKGRCNVTNFCTLLNELIENVPVNGRFLFGAFSRFMPCDTMDFFEELGVELTVERGNRVFPASERAVDIVDALVKFAKNNGVKIITGRAVKLECNNSHVTAVITEDGRRLEYDEYIIATGGLSYPLTGSTGDGYTLAMDAGHTIVPTKPSLVPIETEDAWCKELQGLSLKNITVRIYDTQKFNDIYTDFGEMLFTHFGVSGPVILSASSHMRKAEPGRYKLIIDMKPALSEKKLDDRILRDISKYANKDIVNAMADLLPSAMIPAVIEQAGVDANLKANQLTREMRGDLVFALKNMTAVIKGFRPIDEAVITSGGVNVKEIEPATMRSKKADNLLFAGEVIDVDAYTGGFNLQIAFSTGMLAGSNV